MRLIKGAHYQAAGDGNTMGDGRLYKYNAKTNNDYQPTSRKRRYNVDPMKRTADMPAMAKNRNDK